MTTDLQLNKYLRKSLKLAVGHTQGTTELARLKSFSSWQGVATCSVLDCNLEELKVQNVFRLGGVAWRGLHELLILFWKVPCIQQCRT